MVIKLTTVAALVLACAASGQAQQQKPPAPPQPSSSAPRSILAHGDRDFFMKAAEAGEKEVEFARLAQQKAASSEVKALAARLEKDHQQAGEELKSLAQSKDVTLPATVKVDTSKFQKLEGPAFDRAYSNMMVQDHKAAISLFETASKSKDPEIKTFAEKMLPTLREHLKMAQQAQSAKPTATSGTSPAPASPMPSAPAKPSPSPSPAK